MKTRGRVLLRVALASAVSVGAGCSSSPSAPGAPGATALVSVTPQGGAVGVSTGARIVVEFDHALGSGMQQYMDLHEQDVAGPEVSGDCVMSDDSMSLVFTPADSLAPGTTYVVHVGGGMMDDDGQPVDLGQYGMGMGGAWVTQAMMDGAGMGPGMMGADSVHMGTGWQDTQNGTWGMEFGFTTTG